MDFHTLWAAVVSVVDAEGSPVTSDMKVILPGSQEKSEFELVFGAQKAAQAFKWLSQYCTSHLHEFVDIGALFIAMLRVSPALIVRTGHFCAPHYTASACVLLSRTGCIPA